MAYDLYNVLCIYFRRWCRHRDEKDDYIQPVYKSNDQIQDKVQLALANTGSMQQKGACGSSLFPGTEPINRIGGRVVDKPVNDNGEGAYYEELREGSGELIYDSIQESHAVYEQIKNERRGRDPGYAELDSIKCNAGGYCVPSPSQPKKPSNLNKTECLKDSVQCNAGGYSVPCIIRPKTPSKIDKAGHLKDSIKCGTDGYCVPFTYGPVSTANVNKIKHLEAQLSNSKIKIKTENDDYLIPLADKP